MALAINLEGRKELLGLWIDQAEGARFWLKILNELKNRGVQDVLIAAVYGLSEFPEAISAVFPKTEVQFCMVCRSHFRRSVGIAEGHGGTFFLNNSQGVYFFN